MSPFGLAPGQPVRIEHLCACMHCGAVYGPLNYYLASPDGISRMINCPTCDPCGDAMPVVSVSNVGDFLGAGIRAVSR